MTDTRRRPPVTRHLGQVAYLAYWRALAPLALPWAKVTREEQHAWQACARAVLRAAAAATQAREEAP